MSPLLGRRQALEPAASAAPRPARGAASARHRQGQPRPAPPGAPPGDLGAQLVPQLPVHAAVGFALREPRLPGAPSAERTRDSEADTREGTLGLPPVAAANLVRPFTAPGAAAGPPPAGERPGAPAMSLEDLRRLLRSAPAGAPAPPDLRRDMESATGHSLAAARIHRGPEIDRIAGALGTAGLSVGDQILLGSGASERVLRHELAHVAQRDGRGPDLERPLALGGRSEPAEREAAGKPLWGCLDLAGLHPGRQIGATDDPLEREADRVAERVIREPAPATVAPPARPATPPTTAPSPSAVPSQGTGQAPTLQRKCATCQAEDELHRSPEPTAGQARTAEAPAQVRPVLESQGEPLDPATRGFFEPSLGQDLGEVRVHRDGAAGESARAVGARAYTVGSHIAFATGQYSTSTDSGRLLLAHELAHVAQGAGRPPEGGRADVRAESEARRAASLAVQGQSSTLTPRRFGLALDGPTPGQSEGQGALDSAPGQPKSEDAKPKKPSYALPPGLPWAIQGYVAVTPVSWIKAQGWDGQAGAGISLPEVTRVLVKGAVRQLGWTWVTDEALEKQLPKMSYSLDEAGDAEFIGIGLVNLFSYFGPPDDLLAYWLPQGDGMLLVLKGETARASPSGVTPGGVTTLKDPQLNARVVEQLEARTGMPIPGGRRSALLQLGIPVDPAQLASEGVMQPYPRGLMEGIYGKDAWAAWLANRGKDGEKGGQGKGPGGAKGEVAGGKPGGVAGGTDPAGKVEDVQRLRAIYDFLRQAHPDLVGDKSFEDFVSWLKGQKAPEDRSKETAPWPEAKDPEQWRTFAEHFANNTLLPKEMLSDKPTWPLRPDYVFKPNGVLQVRPEIPDARYPVGAEAGLRMHMVSPPAENVLVNAFPRKADFHWSWAGPKGGLSGLGRGLGDANGDQERDVKFDKPGVYILTVRVSSEYFRGGEILEISRTVTAVDPAQRLEELAEDQLASGYGAFERDAEGHLKVRNSLAGEGGEKALGLEARERALSDQIARIESLVKEGKIAKSDGDEAIGLIRDQIKKLGEFKEEAGSTGRPYVASAVFLSEESGASFPVNLSVYGTVTRKDGQVSYQVLIADLSSLAAAPRYVETVEARVAEGDSAGMAALEKRAVAAASEEFRKHNLYPNGRVRLFLRLHESGAVHTENFTTRSGRKTAKRAVGYVGMGLGSVALVGGVVFTEGTTTPIWIKVIAASAALAGVVEVGMNVEQRIQSGQFGDKLSVEALDAVQVAASLMGLKALSAAKPVAGGFQVALKVGDLTQVAFLGASVKVQIDEAEAECTAQKAAGTDPKVAAAERDRKVATILQGAAMTGGFMLFAHALHAGSGGRAAAEVDTRGKVREGIREMALNGSREEIAARLNQRGLNQSERTLLTHAYESAGKPKPPPRQATPPESVPPAAEGGGAQPGQRAPGPVPDQGSQAKVPAEGPQGKPVPEPVPKVPGEPPIAKQGQPPIPPAETPAGPRSAVREGGDGGSKDAAPQAGAAPEPRTLSPRTESYPEGLVELELTRGEAYQSYHQGIEADASREVAIYVDPVTNEHVVVQGGSDFVGHEWMPEVGPGRQWRLVEHYHPGGDIGARFGSPEDFAVMLHWQSSGAAPTETVSTRIRWVDPESKLQFTTDIGYTPGADRPFWIRYRDAHGKWQVQTFEDTPWNAGSDYIRFLQGQGIPQPTIPKPRSAGGAAPEGPAALPPAPAAAMPAFNRNQKARLKDVRDALHDQDLGWEALGLHDESDVARFFAGQTDLDAGIRALERRLRSRLALSTVHAEAQGAAGDTRKAASSESGLPKIKGGQVPEGQRMPRGTETTDPDYGGFWGGERGDSEWFSDVRRVNEVTNYEPVRFRKGFPDLSPWARERVFMRVTGNDKVDFGVADRLMAQRRGFANQTAYAEWRSANRWTWHHVEGAEEMILVARDLHENLPHVGGASEAKSGGAGP